MKSIGGLTALILTIVLVVTLISTADAQEFFNVQSTELKVYRDGLASITQLLSVNELSPEITVPLLSSSIENLLVLDPDQLTVDFHLNNSSLTIFTLGINQLTIEYDTAVLTSKQADVWTITLDSSYDLTLLLPQNSTIVYLNNLPRAIGTTTNEVSLSLSPNHWEISYILPLQQEGEQNNENRLAYLPIEYLILIIISAIIIAILLMIFLQRKRKINVKKTINRNPTLSKDDIAVIEFLAEKDGKAFEAEIRQRFPDMPRTSLWRLVRRLEGLEIVEIKRIGLENQVQLVKK